MNRYMFLEEREFLYQASNNINISNIIEKPEGKSFYIGIDPTANSLHVGHLSGLMVAKALASFGMQAIIVIGGGTAMIGDPSGKSEMRSLITEDQINENIKGLEKQIDYIFPKENKAIVINNSKWLKQINMIEYLREIGRHFSVNRMLTQDCVKTRMDSGISYLEFSYMILQAYDFAYLNKNYNCVLQIGGADQWGNMVMGIDLCRRLNKTDVECFTFPLITNSSGEKMGKTAKGALWLDEDKTSAYDYYQYWLSVDDQDAIKLLKRYTNIQASDIAKYQTYTGKELIIVKEILAYEATSIVHGKEKAIKARETSKALFNKEKGSLEDVEGVNYNFTDGDVLVTDLLKDLKLAPSKSEARRLILGGGVYINEEKILEIDFRIYKNKIENKSIVIRVGKKKYLKVNID